MSGNSHSGRRPTPSETKKARGNPGGRPLPEDEPKPDVGAKCPSYVTGKARDHWKDIARQLTAVRVLTVMDEAALAAYCIQFNRYMDAKVAVERHGLTMVTITGHLVIRPEVDIMDRAHDRMIKLLMEFGCTPASRTKVRVAKGAEDRGNKFAKGATIDDDD